MARDLHGPFPARVSFQPIDGPYVLGLLFGPRLLPAHYWHVPLMGQIRPTARSARLWHVNPLRRFQPVLAFSLLTAHTFLGSFPALDYFRPVTGLFP